MNDRNRHRRHLLGIMAATTLLALGGPALGQEEEASQVDAASTGPDTSEWQCESCPFTYGWGGDLVFGLGYISDDFDDFGNFGGLEDDGVFGVLGGDLFYRDEDARYLEAHGDRLGLDSRRLSVEGGRQGSYSLRFEYDSIPYGRANGTRTVFQGAGTADQTLPSDWVFDDTTDGMAQLGSSLRAVDVEQERETLRLGLAVRKQDPWRYRVNVEHSTREGSMIRGGSFVYRAAELVAPVDYETTRVEAAVGYVRDTWELEAAYNVSVFDNSNDSLRWRNPFTPVNGGVEGELAEPPDNQSHQVMLSGSWRGSSWLAVAGQVAMAKLEQDEPFLATTLNPNFAVPGLPRPNLDGDVTTRVANLRVTGRLTDRLSAKAELGYDERDNDTPRDAFLQVITDTYLTDFRTNEPYSFERESGKLEVDYRLFSKLRLTASAEREEMERTFQEVEDTETDLYKLQARSTPLSGLNLRLELNHEERDNDLDPALLGPRVNPGLRRFHFADKERQAARLVADYAIRENLMAGLFVEVADEDFRDTRVGLSDARSESAGLDLSAIISERVSAHAFVSMEDLDADIIGADIFDPGNLSGVPWRAEQNDEFRTAGFGLEFNELPGKWVRGSIDVRYASGNGVIRVDKGDAAPEFPELQTSRYSLEASAERELRDNMNLKVGYLVARRDEDDFHRDNIGPDSVPDLLGLGETTPDDMVHVIRAMLRYRF